MKHYWRVYKTLLRLNLAYLLAYRANLINSAFVHFIWGSFVILSMVLLTSKVSTIFGWTRDELLVLAGTYNVVMSFFYFFLSRNFSEFADIIHYGRLDSILLKPIDSQFLMSVWIVNYTQVIRLVIGIAFLAYMFQRMHLTLTLPMLGNFILLTIFSVMIIYSVWYMVMTITVWFSKLSNLVNLMYEVNSIIRFPGETFRAVSIYLFVAIFPLTLVIVLPAKALLQKVTMIDFLWSFFFAFALFFATRAFWKFALRSYTSASG